MIVLLGGSFIFLDIDVVLGDSVVDEIIIFVNFDMEVEYEEEDDEEGFRGDGILWLVVEVGNDGSCLGILKGLKN